MTEQLQNAKFSPLWEKSKIFEESTLRDALQAISEMGGYMACVVDSHGALLGIMTDADIRRALLKGAAISDTVKKWYQDNPVTAPDGKSAVELSELAITQQVREMPIINAENHLIDVFVQNVRDRKLTTNPTPHANQHKLNNPMLILAGGLGTRLRSVVSDKPKALAEVGGKAMIETIIDHAASCGINKFYIAVNYLADKVVEFLQAPKFAQYEIVFLHEKQRLGTAGALSLIEEQLQESLIVTNADVLTTIDFFSLTKTHNKNEADITCTVKEYQHQVPYGVVKLKDEQIIAIKEKPVYQHFVNAGIYVLKPEVLSLVPKNTYFDMPSLLEKVLAQNKKVIPFVMYEYWKDVGKPDDYKEANEDYDSLFGNSNKAPH